MEEDFDLRPYITLLLTNWKFIVFPTVILALIAFGINSLIATPSYSASAIVAIISSNENIEIDRTISQNNDRQPLAAFPELALSDEVLSNMLLHLDVDDETPLTDLRNNLESVSGADKSIIILTAKAENPEMAAQMANVWAEMFVEVANRLYVRQNQEQVLFFEEQLSIAESALSEAESTLSNFQAQNQAQIITRTLAVYEQQYTGLLQKQADIAQLNENASLLLEQMLNQPTSNTNIFADQLTYLQLQLQTFDNQSGVPIILQINDQESLSSVDKTALINSVEGLVTTLENKDLGILNDLAELEPKIIALQQEGLVALLEYDRLLTNLDIAKQTHNALAYQVSEERIVAQDKSSGFQLASRAVIPNETTKSNPLLAAAMGAILGAILSVSVILLNNWWNRQSDSS